MRHLPRWLLLCAATFSAYGASNVGPWDLDVLYQAPKWEKTDLAPKPGMAGILYDALPYKEKRVQVFAYYSLPTGKAPEGGWPAVVCVHGGGGTAFELWVKKWNDQGYAAISMDLEGHIPVTNEGKNATGRKPTPNPGPSRVGVFGDYAEPLEEQWYYHAVAQVLLAHSLIRSFPEVNPEKTGLIGVSWGGNLTSSTMGVDTRFKFAIPIYGCGYLSGSGGHQGRAIAGGKHTEIVDTHYDGKAYFANVTYPTLWVNGTNDLHFEMPSTQKSARAVKGPVTLRYQLRMPHGHGPAFAVRECYAFANSVIKGTQPLLTLGKPEVTEGVARASVSAPAKSAQLLYTTDSKSIWPDKEWKAIPASVEESSVSAKLPADTVAFYFAVTDARGYMVSTEYQQP